MFIVASLVTDENWKPLVSQHRRRLSPWPPCPLRTEHVNLRRSVESWVKCQEAFSDSEFFLEDFRWEFSVWKEFAVLTAEGASQVALSGIKPACQCRRCKRSGFDLWVGKISWRRAWQPTPVFLPGESPWIEESGGLQFMGLQRVGHDQSDLSCTQAWIYAQE